MLKARLFEHEMQKREEKSQKETNAKTDIGWGHQIRSYVLQPYQLVKDLRTKIENTNPSRVLNGEIDEFIEEGIKTDNEKSFFIFFFSTFLLIILFATILSTKGVETYRFNKVITKKVAKIDDNLKLEISTIKFKFDIKEISLFLETSNPQIKYKDSFIPTKNIKVYIDLVSLIKSDTKIQKIILDLDQLDIDQLKNISINFKPSNFVQFLNNKIQKGKLSSTIELYFDKNKFIGQFYS